MQVDVVQSTPTYTLQRSISLYGANEDSIDMVMVHPVKLKDGIPMIQEGQLATKAAILEMFSAVREQVKKPLQILHPNILAITDESLIWWQEARMQKVAFKCNTDKKLGRRSRVVPNPALLFAVHKGEWYVFALPENKRPTADTLLYVAPYFNVWAGGKICVGSTQLPKEEKASDPEAWYKAFFSSAFTHPNIHDNLVRYPKGAFAFWNDMMDGKFEQFPNEVLEKSYQTLGMLLTQFQRGY